MRGLSFATFMRPLNAIPAVVAAPPGIVSAHDLPHGRRRHDRRRVDRDRRSRERRVRRPRRQGRRRHRREQGRRTRHRALPRAGRREARRVGTRRGGSRRRCRPSSTSSARRTWRAPADAADRDASFALVAAAVDTFGTVDGVVANAVDVERLRSAVEHISEADLDVTVRGRRQGHALAHAGGVPGHAGPGSRPHRDVRVERRARRRRDLRRVLGGEGGDPGPDPHRRHRVGPVRHHRQLRVPGVGAPPHARASTIPSCWRSSSAASPANRSRATVASRRTSRRSSASSCPTPARSSPARR